MKKFLSTLSVILVLVMCVVVAGCNKGNTTGNKFKSDKDMFAFAAASSSNILAGSNNAVAKMEAVEQKLDMDQINEYVKLMENLLDGDGPILVAKEASDKAEYETKLVYKVRDLANEETTFVIYYNQTLLNEEEPEEEEDIDEIETEYSLTGIAIVGENTYNVSGSQELEGTEYELCITIELDELNKVILEEENEEDETEYLYKVIKDGQTFIELEFELDTVDGETEISFTTLENGSQVYYEFEKEVKGDETKIKIHHVVDGVEIIIEAKGCVNPETNELVYEYKVNGETFTYNK